MEALYLGQSFKHYVKINDYVSREDDSTTEIENGLPAPLKRLFLTFSCGNELTITIRAEKNDLASTTRDKNPDYLRFEFGIVSQQDKHRIYRTQHIGKARWDERERDEAGRYTLARVRINEKSYVCDEDRGFLQNGSLLVRLKISDYPDDRQLRKSEELERLKPDATKIDGKAKAYAKFSFTSAEPKLIQATRDRKMGDEPYRCVFRAKPAKRTLKSGKVEEYKAIEVEVTHVSRVDFGADAAAETRRSSSGMKIEKAAATAGSSFVHFFKNRVLRIFH